MRIIMHGHHADSLFSQLPSTDARIATIQTEKPHWERELRLALLQDVTDLLPQNEAWVAYNQAQAAHAEAKTIYDEAWGAYVKSYSKSGAKVRSAQIAFDKAEKALVITWRAYLASFDTDAFHAEHCHPNCPWDGATIFSKGVGIGVLG